MLSIKIKGKEELSRKLQPKTITKPLTDSIKKLTIELNKLVKTATVVDRGRLINSIVMEVSKDTGKVSTNVVYAPFVELGYFSRAGTFVEARHMEGMTKVLGEGMFTYALRRLNAKLGGFMRKLGVGIEKEFERR